MSSRGPIRSAKANERRAMASQAGPDNRKAGRALGPADRGQMGAAARGTPLARSLDAEERGMRGLSNEHARVFAPDGTLLLSKDGRPTTRGKYAHVITFTADEVARMRGAVFTHNHPGGHSFSDSDVEFAARNGLAEIRAVTADARYSLKPGIAGWSPKMWTSVIRPAYARAVRQVMEEQQMAIFHGALTTEEADRVLDHQVWERVAREAGLKYRQQGWAGTRGARR